MSRQYVSAKTNDTLVPIFATVVRPMKRQNLSSGNPPDREKKLQEFLDVRNLLFSILKFI